MPRDERSSGGSLLSDLSGRVVCWALFLAAVHVFYYAAAPLITRFCKRTYPKAPTNDVPAPLIQNMIEVSKHAFPLYVTMPMLTDLFQVKGWSMACDSVEACGPRLVCDQVHMLKIVVSV